MDKINCKACKMKRKCCAYELCLAAEQYANQDYVGQKEHCFSYIKGCIPGQVPEEDNAFLIDVPVTKLMIAKLYFLYGLKVMEIADITYKSHPYISKVIKEYRAKSARNRFKLP